VSTINAPKGVMEYLPPESAAFLAVREALAAPAIAAGYGYIELATFEHTELFVRGVGESTDVVSKEMYTFDDRGGRSLSLRPEGTAGVMRAVIEHRLDRGAFFRAEAPQLGRYRQFFQVGVEAIGVDDPALDAEVIAIGDDGFRSLGLTDYTLDITSLGDEICRPAYRERLVAFLDTLDLDEATRARAHVNPLRVLDDKRAEVRRQLADAPLIIDHLCDACAEHFAAVRAYLDALRVRYTLNPRLVRGLDYYTKTTFEFVHKGLGSQSGIGGGGRYDGLMAELGGQPLSGIGFGLGIDRAVLACRVEGRLIGDIPQVAVFFVPLGDAARVESVAIVGELRRAGIHADLAYGSKGLKGAMKAADRSGAAYAVVVGDRDLEAGVAQVKDLASGDQSAVPLTELVATLKETLP
jgi:histidyl-tRNA synthetase